MALSGAQLSRKWRMARRARLCGLWFAAATRFFCAGPRVANGPRKLGGPFGASSGKGLSCWAECRELLWTMFLKLDGQRSRDCALCTYAVISHWQSRAGILLDLNAGCSFVRRAFGVGICCRPSFKGSDVAMWAPSEVAHAKALRSSHKVNFWVMAGVQVGRHLCGFFSGGGLFSKARVHEGPGRLNFELWLNAWVFLTFWFGNALRTIVACNSFLSDLGDIAPHPPLLGNLLSDPPDYKLIGTT